MWIQSDHNDPSISRTSLRRRRYEDFTSFSDNNVGMQQPSYSENFSYNHLPSKTIKSFPGTYLDEDDQGSHTVSKLYQASTSRKSLTAMIPDPTSFGQSTGPRENSLKRSRDSHDDSESDVRLHKLDGLSGPFQVKVDAETYSKRVRRELGDFAARYSRQIISSIHGSFHLMISSVIELISTQLKSLEDSTKFILGKSADISSHRVADVDVMGVKAEVAVDSCSNEQTRITVLDFEHSQSCSSSTFIETVDHSRYAGVSLPSDDHLELVVPVAAAGVSAAGDVFKLSPIQAHDNALLASSISPSTVQSSDITGTKRRLLDGAQKRHPVLGIRAALQHRKLDTSLDLRPADIVSPRKEVHSYSKDLRMSLIQKSLADLQHMAETTSHPLSAGASTPVALPLPTATSSTPSAAFGQEMNRTAVQSTPAHNVFSFSANSRDSPISQPYQHSSGSSLRFEAGSGSMPKSYESAASVTASPAVASAGVPLVGHTSFGVDSSSNSRDSDGTGKLSTEFIPIRSALPTTDVTSGVSSKLYTTASSTSLKPEPASAVTTAIDSSAKSSPSNRIFAVSPSNLDSTSNIRCRPPPSPSSSSRGRSTPPLSPVSSSSRGLPSPGPPSPGLGKKWGIAFLDSSDSTANTRAAERNDSVIAPTAALAASASSPEPSSSASDLAANSQQSTTTAADESLHSATFPESNRDQIITIPIVGAASTSVESANSAATSEVMASRQPLGILLPIPTRASSGRESLSIPTAGPPLDPSAASVRSPALGTFLSFTSASTYYGSTAATTSAASLQQVSAPSAAAPGPPRLTSGFSAFSSSQPPPSNTGPIAPLSAPAATTWQPPAVSTDFSHMGSINLLPVPMMTAINSDPSVHVSASFQFGPLPTVAASLSPPAHAGIGSNSGSFKLGALQPQPRRPVKALLRAKRK